jgi:hypothetical protein
MGMIAYPPVYDAKRIARPVKTPPPPKVIVRRPKVRPAIDPALRAQIAFDEFNRMGLKILRERGMPQVHRELVRQVAARRNVTVMLIAGSSQKVVAVRARNEAMYLIKQSRPMLSAPLLAKWFDRDHTSVLHGLANHAHRAGLPNLTGFDIDRVRRRNARLAAELRGKQAEHLRRER